MFVWHGTMDFVLIWSLLNFLGISLEGVARVVASQPGYRRLEDGMSPQMARRLHALLATPLLVMSSLSNFYFFAGTQVWAALTDVWEILFTFTAGWSHLCQADPPGVLACGNANTARISLLQLSNVDRSEELQDKK